MTVSNDPRRLFYDGDGSSTEFAVTFGFFEIDVFVNGILMSLGVDYTITQDEAGGTGTVVFVTAPESGTDNVVVVGDTAFTQGADYRDNDEFPAETFESSLDRSVMIGRENYERVNRTIRGSDFGPDVPALDFAAKPRAIIATNNDGVPTLYDAADADSPIIDLLPAALLTSVLRFKGAWDASAGTFPDGDPTVKGDFYKVSEAGTVDGISFSEGDDLYAVVDDAATDTYADNWVKIRDTLSTDAIASIEPAHTGAIQKAEGEQTTTAIIDLVFVIGDAQTLIATGINGQWTGRIDFDYDILGWAAVGNESGTIAIDLLQCDFSDFDAGNTHPVSGDKINGSSSIGFTSATKGSDDDLSDWTSVTGDAGSMLAANVTSVTSSTQVKLVLKLRKKS